VSFGLTWSPCPGRASVDQSRSYKSPSQVAALFEAPFVVLEYNVHPLFLATLRPFSDTLRPGLVLSDGPTFLCPQVTAGGFQPVFPVSHSSLTAQSKDLPYSGRACSSLEVCFPEVLDLPPFTQDRRVARHFRKRAGCHFVNPGRTFFPVFAEYHTLLLLSFESIIGRSQSSGFFNTVSLLL